MAWRTEHSRRLAALVATLTLLCGLVACGGGDGDDSLLGNGQDAGVTAAQARTQEQRILNQRVRAVRDRDLDLFLQRVDHGDQGLMARQRRYFQNLVQLPLAVLTYRVLDGKWEGLEVAPRWGDDVDIPQILLTMQLEGYDAVPVERTVGFVFSFREGRATIVSDRTSTGKALFVGAPAPWDLTAITVREDGDVLGIFDRGMRASASTVTSAVRNGIAQIDRALPFSWAGHVVVYSVQSPGVLSSFTDVPGGSLDHLGALTFPTYAGKDRSQVASTRMLMMPSSVRAGEPFLGRITRHELSHVAIGVRDDGAPAWVSEGVAEYLGARDIKQGDRIIPTSAVSRAQTEDDAMPVTQSFNNTDQEWHYALSWMACDYIADTFGESRLWELVDAMHNGGDGTSDAEQDRVLQQLLGFDGRELSRRAAARIRNLYG
ncbi:MAG: hypothetical protein JWR85_3366 [Marmoricola sp.]|nr:hypothetical protein [Marmoricola sp.]